MGSTVQALAQAAPRWRPAAALQPGSAGAAAARPAAAAYEEGEEGEWPSAAMPQPLAPAGYESEEEEGEIEGERSTEEMLAAAQRQAQLERCKDSKGAFRIPKRGAPARPDQVGGAVEGWSTPVHEWSNRRPDCM